MGIASTYPDHKCGKCGIMIKKGDQVNKIEATGQWCSNTKCPEPKPQEETAPDQLTDKPVQQAPQAKDFDEMQNKSLFDDGYTRALRKLYLLRGIRKAIPNEDAPVIGMIFNQICADLRNQEI